VSGDRESVGLERPCFARRSHTRSKPPNPGPLSARLRIESGARGSRGPSTSQLLRVAKQLLRSG